MILYIFSNSDIFRFQFTADHLSDDIQVNSSSSRQEIKWLCNYAQRKGSTCGCNPVDIK